MADTLTLTVRLEVVPCEGTPDVVTEKDRLAAAAEYVAGRLPLRDCFEGWDFNDRFAYVITDVRVDGVPSRVEALR